MREVLQNCVERIPVIGHRPDPEKLSRLEINGYLTATYPKIDMKFLSWTKDGFPQFAVFWLDSDTFTYGRNWSGSGFAHVGDGYFIPRGMAQHYAKLAQTLQRGRERVIRYSGLMTERIREEVHRFKNLNLSGVNVWVVAEVEPSSWTEQTVRFEDPMVVISRGEDMFWLLGWYDLTAGEDRVLGIMTE